MTCVVQNIHFIAIRKYNYEFHLWKSFLYTLAFFEGRHGALAGKGRKNVFGVLALLLRVSLSLSFFYVNSQQLL